MEERRCSAIETYYLIDYENVTSKGLIGCKLLNKSDHILIFFTGNSRKLDLGDIARHGAGSFNAIEVPPGKQSVDIHIISYLGYLAGKHEGSQIGVVIISKDTDYDHVIKFWNTESGIKISRRANIQDAKTSQKPQGKADAPKPASTSQQNSKTALNNQIIQKLRQQGYSGEIASYVASTAIKNLDTKGGKQQTYRTIISKFKQAKGLEIYRHIKNMI